MMKTQVLYKSRTGNTEKLAKAIFEAVPGKNKDIQSLDERKDYKMGDVYFIGFWTDRGTASTDILDCLGSLQGKKIALFGTCGMGGSPEYYKRIEENVRVFIEDDNQYLGAYFCQGKMPMAVREKYTAMRTQKNARQIDAMIQNFDRALLHPDAKDLEGARAFVKKIYETLEKDGGREL